MNRSGASGNSHTSPVLPPLPRSDQVKGRQPFGKDWYVLSDEELDYSNTTLLDGAGVFRPRLGGVESTPRELDYGSVYASKAFLADDRVVWFGWVYETSLGCTEMCSAGAPSTDSMGFQGSLTLPRQVGYDATSQELTLSPLPELEALRLRLLYQGNGMLLPNNVMSGSGSLDDAKALNHVRLSTRGSAASGQLEVTAVFQLPAATGGDAHTGGRKNLPAGEDGSSRSGDDVVEFRVGLKLLFGGRGQEVLVSLRGEAAPSPDGRLLARSLHVSVDRSRARSRAEDGLEARDPQPVQGGQVSLGSSDPGILELHVFIDRSIVEVYCQGGRGRVTSRIYPALADNDYRHSSLSSGSSGRPWELAVLGGVGGGAGRVTASVKVWELDSCWVASLPDQDRPQGQD